jgi:hypothetical protein
MLIHHLCPRIVYPYRGAQKVLADRRPCSKKWVVDMGPYVGFRLEAAKLADVCQQPK